MSQSPDSISHRLAAARVMAGGAADPPAITQRRLRLVGKGEAKAAKVNARYTEQAVSQAPDAQRITDASDPRWVLATRTAALLQGSVLPPDKRETLLRTGRTLGLSAFDSNLVIAIIQDQARRGQLPEYCPQAGVAQLEMVPKPLRWTWRNLNLLNIAILVGMILTLQALLIMMIMK